MKIPKNLEPIVSGVSAAVVIGVLAFLTLRTSAGVWIMFSFGATVFLVFVLSSGIFFMRDINFDSDPMKLKDQNSQSVILALKLMEQNPSSDYTISVFKKEIDNKNS